MTKNSTVSQGLVTVSLAGLLVMLSALSALALRGPVFDTSAQGAFGINYLQDRALVTTNVEARGHEGETFSLSVRLPEPVKWVYLDGEPLGADEFSRDDAQNRVILQVPYGDHRLHLGWSAEPNLPPESAQIPVFHQGEQIGTLRAFFDLEGMEASGELDVGPGRMAMSIIPAGEIAPGDLTASCGTETIDKWKPNESGFGTTDHILIDKGPTLTINLRGAALSRVPVERVVISEVVPPSPVVKVADEIPGDAILVEAEDYTDSTGTAPGINPGSHYDTHGGACAFSLRGDGSTIDWIFEVPRPGKYNLYARMACGDVGSFRIIEVDGRVPEGLELVEMPATSGWGHADGEWWLVRLTGEGTSAPSLKLDAGEHTVTFTGVLQHHLNLDYLLLVPAD